MSRVTFNNTVLRDGPLGTRPRLYPDVPAVVGRHPRQERPRPPLRRPNEDEDRAPAHSRLADQLSRPVYYDDEEDFTRPGVTLPRQRGMAHASVVLAVLLFELPAAGVEMPVRLAIVTVTARWLHASNNGRESRQRNPDIQSLGAVVSVGWEY